ncbi:hypothetical protein [Flagellimonas nanhaiensis]|uniref:Uncharacterized protein n=1 Tax=Flagellimonas nanhaiensis TaxID=2292706 RepID=A0A371JV61_9FLAO|nr:hypothetical protein [Allomuricauda nanhaiensis]RDY61687.1 hypothetical protein DX873_05915 [Allomuricauda nanhaiensis]
MNDHYQLSDSDFEKKFEDCSLEPSLFNHEAHVRLAWVYIKKYGEAIAIQKICEDIKRFDRTHGDGNKFHVTLTVASVKAVNHFIKKSSSSSFKAFIGEFPRLKTSFKELLDQHYGFNVLSDEKAKTIYVLPDLVPFS